MCFTCSVETFPWKSRRQARWLAAALEQSVTSPLPHWTTMFAESLCCLQSRDVFFRFVASAAYVQPCRHKCLCGETLVRLNSCFFKVHLISSAVHPTLKNLNDSRLSINLKNPKDLITSLHQMETLACRWLYNP